MYEIIKEAIEAMEQVNEDIYNMLGVDEFPSIIAETSGSSIALTFAGETIWYDDDDDRQFIEDKNDYEPLVPFLKRKIMKVIQGLNRIQFKEE